MKEAERAGTKARKESPPFSVDEHSTAKDDEDEEEVVIVESFPMKHAKAKSADVVAAMLKDEPTTHQPAEQ